MATNKKPGKSKNAMTQQLKRVGNRPGKRPSKDVRLRKLQADMRARFAAEDREREALEAKHQLFASEYMKDFNGTQAVMRCGITQNAHSASVIAVRLLADVRVKNWIEELKSQRMVRDFLSTERILAETMKIALFNPFKFLRKTKTGDLYFDFTDLNEDDAAAFGEFNIDVYTEGHGKNAREVKSCKFKPISKTEALKLLGQYKKMWTDKHEVQGAMSLEFFSELLADVPVGTAHDEPAPAKGKRK